MSQVGDFLQSGHCQVAGIGHQTSQQNDCLSCASVTTSWHQTVRRNSSHVDRMEGSLKTRVLAVLVCNFWKYYTHTYIHSYTVRSPINTSHQFFWQSTDVSLTCQNQDLLTEILWRANVTLGLALPLMSPKCWIQILTQCEFKPSHHSGSCPPETYQPQQINPHRHSKHLPAIPTTGAVTLLFQQRGWPENPSDLLSSPEEFCAHPCCHGHLSSSCRMCPQDFLPRGCLCWPSFLSESGKEEGLADERIQIQNSKVVEEGQTKVVCCKTHNRVRSYWKQ